MKKRLLSLLLALAMVLTLLPAPALAAEETTQTAAPVAETVAETVQETVQAAADAPSGMEHLLTDGKLKGSLTRQPLYAAKDNGYYTDVADVINLLRSSMVSRTRGITLPLRVSKEDIHNEAEMEALILGIFALATAHTGVPTEGDYILWCIKDLQYGARYTESADYYYLNIGFSLSYYISQSMEASVTRKVDQIMARFNFTKNTDDYSKVLAIYDYICSNIKYSTEDNEGMSDEFYKFTAYGALIENSAVCQGYAAALYRLLLEAGVDCRVIAGYDAESGIGHAWNIVQLDGVYYNLDSTWDAGYFNYLYFLKGSSDFTDHIRDEAYDLDEFHTLYPMSPTDYVPADPTVISSGSCGADAQYTVYSDGYMEITGTGAMTNWSSAAEVPWKDCYGYIRFVSVADGITSVGSYAFAECSSLLWLDLPNSVAEIGSYTFHNAKLKTFIVPTSLRKIGDHAFATVAGCREVLVIQDLAGWLALEREGERSSPGGQTWYLGEEKLTHLVIPEGTTSIRDYAFSGANITSVHIPDSVTSIGNHAFSYNYELTQVTGCQSVSHVGDFAFHHADPREINLPGIKTIGAGAFSACNNLQKLTLGPGLTRVGSKAFSAYYHSLDLYISDLAAWCNIDFEYIPDGAMKRISSNPLWLTENFYCNGELITDLVIPDGVTTIKNYAFAEYDYLTSVTVPESVNTVGADVFFGAFFDFVHFLGDAPAFQSDSFTKSSFTAYYPADDDTWTEEVRQQYGGTVTWKPVCSGPHTEAIDEAVPPTCTQTGLSEGKHCAACGLILVPQQTVPVIPHTEESIPAVAPTCTETGLTTGVKCSVCGEILTPQETVPALPHTFVDGTCTVCGAPERVPGDFTSDDLVTNEDVSYLLWHTLFPADYPLNNDADFTGDGAVTNEDVSYLLWHTLFPADYPL